MADWHIGEEERGREREYYSFLFRHGVGSVSSVFRLNDTVIHELLSTGKTTLSYSKILFVHQVIINLDTGKFGRFRILILDDEKRRVQNGRIIEYVASTRANVSNVRFTLRIVRQSISRIVYTWLSTTWKEQRRRDTRI